MFLDPAKINSKVRQVGNCGIFIWFFLFADYLGVFVQCKDFFAFLSNRLNGTFS